jgi:hydroxymethylglutaryl-CoA lyase
MPVLPAHQLGSVHVCEVVLRDGIQGWPELIPTERKIGLLKAISAAGFTEIDVTSFVPPALAPQFADGLDVLAAAPVGVSTRVLAANHKGVQRAIEAHHRVRAIDFCGIPFSASEPHNIANLRRTHAQHREQLKPMIADLLEAGIRPLVAVATAFGCPISGHISQAQVFEIAGWLHDRGVRRLMFGDTTGMGDPRRSHDLFASAVKEWPDTEFVAHFHDNRGAGIANSLAAINAGATSADASLGGLGGEPSTVDQGDVGESGNVATEDLVALLDRLGVKTGLDAEAVLAAGAQLEKTVGRRLYSRVARAGLIVDVPRRRVETNGFNPFQHC